MQLFKLAAVLTIFNRNRAADKGGAPQFAVEPVRSSGPAGLREGGLARLMEEADREARLRSWAVGPF